MNLKPDHDVVSVFQVHIVILDRRVRRAADEQSDNRDDEDIPHGS